MCIGCIYNWGQGVAVDHPRAMAAYKVAAEGGDAGCQWDVGWMYYDGQGVDVHVDYTQALPWVEKAAAQDDREAVGQLGLMYHKGKGVTPSWRRAREYTERAIELGCSMAVNNMQTLAQDIQEVTSHANQPAQHPHRPFINHSFVTSRFHTPSLFPHTHRPSWASGWRSTARAART